MLIKKILPYLPIVSIFLLALFLRLDRLDSLMPFIGDQGWFYLAARNLSLGGEIPLVGITSSHTWLHQGPLWTYLLALVLPIFNYHPISGAYVSVFFDLAAMFVIYKIGREFFTEKYAIILASLYAVSPLIILHARLSYHTSPISFLVALLIYSLIKVITGKPIFFPIILLIMSFLYNFELATVVFWPVIIIPVVLGIYNKEKWVKEILNKKIITLSFFAFFLPMVPVIIYDFGHGFPQTLKYGVWFIYKILQLVGLYENNYPTESLISVLSFFFHRYQLLSIAQSFNLSITVFLLSLVFLIKNGVTNITKPVGIILLSIIIPLIGFFLSKTASEAYLPMLFPGLILTLGYLFSFLFDTRLKSIVLLVFLFILVSNFKFIYGQEYLAGKAGGFGLPLDKRVDAAEQIIKRVDSKPFRLKLVGEGSQFESSTMNYEYLIWWLSNQEPDKKASLTAEIKENRKEINLKIYSEVF